MNIHHYARVSGTDSYVCTKCGQPSLSPSPEPGCDGAKADPYAEAKAKVIDLAKTISDNKPRIRVRV